MNIQFDSASLTAKEALALTNFLSTLYPGQAQQPTPTTLHEQLKVSVERTVPASSGPILVDRPEEEKSSLQQLEESPGGVQPFNTGRKRRTKAEMAADAAAAAEKPPTVGDRLAAAEAARRQAAAQQAAAQQAAAQQAAAAAAVNGSTKIDANQLRGLLNGYIARHSMEDAIEKLRAFGCNRVTEALALESDKLSQLAATLNG